MKTNSPFARWCIATTWIWMGLFAVIPLALVIVISFFMHDQNNPYLWWQFQVQSYIDLVHNDIFVVILFRSFKLALETTLLCLLLAYPAALIIARTKSKFKNLLLILLVIPFWTSALLRLYGILAIIKAQGLLNKVLGLVGWHVNIAYTTTAVLIGLTYNLLPFMLLPLYSNLEKLDHKLIEAARDLGASRLRILWRVLIPLSMPGIIAGTLLVFLPAMTLFYIPDLMGGAKSLLLGNLIQQEFLNLNNFPAGAATSVALTLLMLLLLFAYQRSLPKTETKEQT